MVQTVSGPDGLWWTLGERCCNKILWSFQQEFLHKRLFSPQTTNFLFPVSFLFFSSNESFINLKQVDTQAAAISRFIDYLQTIKLITNYFDYRLIILSHLFRKNVQTLISAPQCEYFLVSLVSVTVNWTKRLTTSLWALGNADQYFSPFSDILLIDNENNG